MPCNIKKELCGLHTGDVRADRRFMHTAGMLCASPDLSVSASCHSASDTVGAYRVFRSDLVTPEKILAPHRVATVERARVCEGSLLLVQDTCEIDYTSHKATRGLGPLSNKPCKGVFLHSQFLIDEESAVPLGFCGAQMRTRPEQRLALEIPQEAPAPTGKNKAKKRPPPRPIEEKESMRWLLGYREACALSEELPGQEVISIADREADIFDIYAEYQALKQRGEAHAQFIIRVETDRVLEGGTKLFATAYAAALVGTYEVAISATMQKVKTATGSSAKKMRQKRTAHMEVRIVTLNVPPPTRHFNKELPSVELCAVLVSEKDAPEGQDPIEWLLWTTLPVTTLEEALRVVRAYSLRWRIEEFHRVLKSGCKIEELRFAEAHTIHNLVALYMIIAWRILYLRDSTRATPLAPGSAFFSEVEWKSACFLSDRSLDYAPPLGEMLLMVAAFGGYKKRGKKSPPPGPEVLWRGLIALDKFVQMASKMGGL
jgi:IS4 transposase